MKIEMPPEPNVDQLWVRDTETGKVICFNRTLEGWRKPQGGAPRSWSDLITSFQRLYTTHPDFAALDKYPTPWRKTASGTVRDATGKAVLDPTLQCPPCLTALIVLAVNELADRVSTGAAVGACAADKGEEKR
jgi:hypothetical protein